MTENEIGDVTWAALGVHSVRPLAICITAIAMFTATRVIGGDVPQKTKAEWEAQRKTVEKWEQANKDGICEVHHTKMLVREVQIIYGLPAPIEGDAPSEVRWKSFPHAREISFGGCVIMPSSPKTEKIRICPSCKQAEQKWKDTHKPLQ